MVGFPAARVTDQTTHPLAGKLAPGPGSSNVLIGTLPAWRGIPLAAAAALQAAKTVADTAIKVAEGATLAAAGTPGAPVAKAAEETVKSLAAAAMGALINGLAAASTTPLGGMPDIHVCATPLPIPPHGPGVVIDGSPTVLINGLPACVQGDKVLEALGPPDPILMGLSTVLIGDGTSGGMGLFAALASLVAAAAAAAAKVIDFIIDQANAMIELAKQTIKEIVERAKGIVNNLIDSAIRGITSFIKGVEDAAAKVKRALRSSRVKGMDADAADAAIIQSQKDAVAALDKRIKDLDTFDEATKKSFEKWFGASDEATRKKIRDRMVKARDKLNGFTLDNYAADDDDFAYVYPDKDDKMYLGELYGKAPATGPNSKAGTMIHEVSHYDSVGGTKDTDASGKKVYGHKAAAKLAKDDPARAQGNADNFEYFVEDGM